MNLMNNINCRQVWTCPGMTPKCPFPWQVFGPHLIHGSFSPELSMGPFCVTRSNPTYQLTDLTQPNPLQVEKFGPNPTQANATNNTAYSLVVTYFYTENLSRTFIPPSINLFMFFTDRYTY